MPGPGDLLGERYRIVDVLSGGMGEVFICELVEDRDPAKDQNGEPFRLALKTFQRRYFFDNAVRLSFLREATTWLRLSGLPHIMPVLGIEQIGDRPFLQMPVVTPGPLGERSIGDLVKRGPLPPESVLGHAFQLGLALRAAAGRVEGLVHGDIKPSNVLLMNGEALLADFGLVSALSLGRPDVRLEGTWAYRAPELWADEPQAPTVASDVYAFGALLFEMLVGHTPFTENVHDRDAWAAAHRDRLPASPPEYPTEGLPVALMRLAIASLEKEPSVRPKDFTEILERVNTIGQEYDPLDHLTWMMRACKLKSTMDDLAPSLRKERISSLLKLDEPQSALDELDAIDTDQYDAVLWLHRGTALSLLNRDEEALSCFERAQVGELSPDEQVSCQAEYALSLKRLERFDEARRIYEKLMTTVSDENLPLVITNLATVYLEQKQGEEAVRLLEPFVRRMPDSAPAWANLGQGYVFVRRYEDAERAYGRALALAPQEGRIRVMLAALYMDHLGRIEEAWTALDAAFDSGYESREWLVRTLACSILLDRREFVGGLLVALRDNFEESLAKSMLDDARKMSEELAKKYSSGQEDEAKGHQDKKEISEGTAVDSDAVADATNVAPAPSDADSSRRPGTPFLNFRFYDFHDFTLDFYQSPDVSGFVDTFLAEWRRAVRDPRLAMSGASLRGSPFYFTQCPNCGVHVLTNRDVGKQIRCRMCEHLWPTEPLRRSELDEIVAHVSEATAIKEASGESVVHALLVQAPPDVDEAVVRRVCESGGLTELARDELIAIHLYGEFLKRGAKLEVPWTVWRLEDVWDSSWARDATPPKISAIVRGLQSQAPGVRTMSTTLSGDEVSEMSESIHDLSRRMEKGARAAIREGRASVADYTQLANALMFRGELNEAEEKARAAVAVDGDSAEAWQLLAQILFKQDDFDGAREAFEHTLHLSPTSILSMHFLAICYMKLGDDERAHEIRTRAISLSGGELPWQP